MVIITNTTMSVRSEIREALKSFNSNPFSSAGLYDDALNAEDAILIQISDQTKKVTLEDLGAHLNLSGGEGTTYDDTNRLDYEFLKPSLVKTDTTENIQEPTFTQDLYIVEPVSSLSATPIEGTDYKCITFPFVSGYDVEKMYPPVRNLASNSHTVSGQSHGNGLHVVEQSSSVDTRIGYTAFNTSISDGPRFGTNNYFFGVYDRNLFIKSDYLGDWFKIKLPVNFQNMV